jgi:hypothetical protein
LGLFCFTFVYELLESNARTIAGRVAVSTCKLFAKQMRVCDEHYLAGGVKDSGSLISFIYEHPSWRALPCSGLSPVLEWRRRRPIRGLIVRFSISHGRIGVQGLIRKTVISGIGYC